MTHGQKLADAIQKDIDDRILAADRELLDDHGVSDTVISYMAAEHAARAETLAKMIEPTLGRAVLLMISGALISAAKQITDATVIAEPELVV